MTIITRHIYFLLAVFVVSCADSTKKEQTVPLAERATRMQTFVAGLSKSAKSKRPGFLIVPQNGAWLAYNEANPVRGLNASYLRAIDAFGIESLYYNGGYEPDSSRIDILTELSQKKPVLVSEFISDKTKASDAVKKNSSNGFIPFVRTPVNMHYEELATIATGENSSDIDSIPQVKNYLYLINPSKFDTKEEYLAALQKTNFDLLIIDLFFNDHQPLSLREVNLLKTKQNGGRRIVLCYINIGAAENWRHYWDKSWSLGNPDFLARRYHGYDNEFWVKYWDKKWAGIIYDGDDSYIGKIIQAGFNGAYLDNIEAYKYLYSE